VMPVSVGGPHMINTTCSQVDCERVIRTLRSELCNHTLLLNEAHAQKVLAEYQLHYNQHRPIKAENSDHPNGTNSPIEYRKPTPAHCYTPGSSMDSSANTATQLDQQR
jgi:hypothetical protein